MKLGEETTAIDAGGGHHENPNVQSEYNKSLILTTQSFR